MAESRNTPRVTLCERFILSLLLFCVLIANAGAAVKYVTPSGAGAKDGASWGTAYGNAEFITNLPFASSGDDFWLKAGTYKPTTSTTDRTATFQLIDGVILYGGFAGTETASSQRDPETNLTVLSGDIDNNDSQTPVITNIATVTGNSTNSYHVVTGATGATLDGFTVTAAYSENAGYPDYFGGGMYNWNSSPMVTNCTFSGNRTTAGGGMYNWNCSPTVTNCTFTGNQASLGAGMHNSTSSPTVIYCKFSGNLATINGGGMDNVDSSSPMVMGCTFLGNKATRAAAACTTAPAAELR